MVIWWYTFFAMSAKQVKKETKKETVDEVEILEDAEFVEELGYTNKIKELHEKLKECQAEKMEHLTGWQRSKADYANQSEEYARLLGKAECRAKIACIENILPVLDSFAMAMDGSGWKDVDAIWREGVEHIYRQLIGGLASSGMKEINPLHEEFDPMFHQAVENKQVDETTQANKILAVLQKGYLLDDQIIRPARVIVGTI